MFPAVGFCGSRSLSQGFKPFVADVAHSVSASGSRIFVGCAGGADQFVRSAVPSSVVFRVSPPVCRSAFARRSISLVSSLPEGSAFVGFVTSVCPSGLVPSAFSSRCFCGLGSGSWASLALAAGRGLSVFIFRCGNFSLPSAWGSWLSVSSGLFAGSFQLVPTQTSLF